MDGSKGRTRNGRCFAGDVCGDLNRDRRARTEGWEAKRPPRGGGSGAAQSEIGHEIIGCLTTSLKFGDELWSVSNFSKHSPRVSIKVIDAV